MHRERPNPVGARLSELQRGKEFTAASHRSALSILIAALFCFACSLFAESPLPPADELKTFQLADSNLVVELVAAEPDVRAPVAVAWDADGRMFVAEMTDYPSGPVSGRIRLLEDRDGDGRYRHAKIFATDLAFPNGVTAWKNGVLVTAAPDIWFLADTNGDGVADVREKILTGFAEGNQQLRVNGLYWGIDNWIYGCNGRSDGDVKWAQGTPAGSIRRHDFRFRPDTKQFEIIAGNSQFGMGHDDWGNRFPVFNNTPIRHVVMEERYLARQPSLAGTDVVPGISPTNDGNRVFALTSPNLLIPQPVGFFTSACGPSIFRGTALPESYRGNYFVCEPVQNVVQRRVVKPNGSTFIAEYADTEVAPVALRPETTRSAGRPITFKEFLAASDPWFHGVFTATGPDGALYIVDFYRDLVEHPHWVAPELRDKVDWRKGEEHGRIWRVRAKNASLANVEKLSAASNAELIKALKSGNGWTRDTGQRLLFERHATNSIPALLQLARFNTWPQARVAALELLEAFNGLTRSTLFVALNDHDFRVGENAVRLSAASLLHGDERQVLLARLLTMTDDPNARVRLRLACELGDWLKTMPDGEERPPHSLSDFSHMSDDINDGRPLKFQMRKSDIIEALVRLTQHSDLDQWQSIAILASAGEQTWTLLKRVAETVPTPSEEQSALLARGARLIAAGTNSADEQAVFRWLANWKSTEQVVIASEFAAGFKSQREFERAGGSFLAAIREAASRSAGDPRATLRVRVAAVHLIDAGESARLLGANEPGPLQLAAARAVMESNDARTIGGVFARWAEFSKPVRRQLIASAPRSRDAARELVLAVAEGKLPLLEIDPATRQALEKSADPEVKLRATELFKAARSTDRDSVVEKYRASLKLDGDRKHGAEIFERTCAVCHQMQGVGAKVGPDLSGIGQHARETLLVDILDPSRQVLPDFVAYNATTQAGDTYTGFIANESATTATLRRANEPDITLKRSDLKEFSTIGKSLMPDGLEAGMSEQDFADLIEFLRRPDRTLFSQTK